MESIPVSGCGLIKVHIFSGFVSKFFCLCERVMVGG